MFRIRSVETSASGREIVREREVAGDELTIGRAAENTIHLPDLAVEQHHLRVILAGDGRLRLKAEGTLGFAVDGRSTADATIDLAEGGELVVGSYRLQFTGGGDGAAAVEVRQLEDRTGGKDDALRGFALGSVLPSKRWIGWAAVVLILGLFLAVPIFSHLTRAPAKPAIDKPGAVMMDASWSPGALSTVHHGLEDNCEACHVKPFVSVRDEACLSCHKDISGHAPANRQLTARGAPHGFEAIGWDIAHAFNKPGPGACVDCHTEHTGAGRMPPTREKFCADCHGTMDKRLTDTRLADAADFGTLHPQFEPAVFTAPGQSAPQRLSLDTHPRQWDGLRFPHAMHLGKTGGVARMAERLGAARGYGQPLDCSDCHRKTADGVRFLPVNMERDCESCHSLVYDQVGGAFRTLHHGNLRQIRADLLVRDSSPGRAPSMTRQRPGQFGEGGLYSARFSRPAFDPTNNAMGQKGLCGECHYPAAGGGSLAVLPVTQPSRFLMHGWFDHEAHKQQSCSDCHTASRSNSSADLLIPNLSSCRDCHLGESAKKAKVPSGCAMCHTYHPRIGPAAAPRRIAMR